MDFAVFPPEVNSADIETGAGPGPLMAAANSWNGLAESFNDVAAQWGSITSEVSGAWLGPSSLAFQHVAAQQISWMRGMAAVAEQTASQATQAAEAFMSARSSIVPTALIAANRAQLLMLIATNVFGQNTTAIAATEAAYQEMWAQDATAMSVYQAQSQTATSALAQPTAAPAATIPGGLIGFLNGQGIGGEPGLALLFNQFWTSALSSAPVTNFTSVFSLLALLTLPVDLQAANNEANQWNDGQPNVFVPEPRPFVGKGQSVPLPPIKPYDSYTDPDRFYGTAAGGAYRTPGGLAVPPKWPGAQGDKDVPIVKSVAADSDFGRIGMPVLPFVPTINKPGGKADPTEDKKRRKLGVPIVTMRPPSGG